MAVDQTRYRFGPLERRGLIAGWRGGQIAAVSVGLVVGVAVLRGRASLTGLSVAVLSVCAGIVIACWPIRGRTAEQWLPLVVVWFIRQARGRRRYLASAAVYGSVWGVGLDAAQPVPSECDSPEVLRGCRVISPPVAQGSLRMGVVKDARARTYTAVVALEGPQLRPPG